MPRNPKVGEFKVQLHYKTEEERIKGIKQYLLMQHRSQKNKRTTLYLIVLGWKVRE